jgi:hypothetical protein
MKNFRHVLLFMGVLFFILGVATPPYTTRVAILEDGICVVGLFIIVKDWREAGKREDN